MVRISSKTSRRVEQKKKASVKPIEVNNDAIDQTPSSKILHVVRQALLNAAEELVSQQQREENLHENSVSFQTFGMNNNHDLKKIRQRNGNSIKKKKFGRK